MKVFKKICLISYEVLKKILLLTLIIPFSILLGICALVNFIIDACTYREETKFHIGETNSREQRRIDRKHNRRHKYLDLFVNYCNYAFTC